MGVGKTPAAVVFAFRSVWADRGADWHFRPPLDHHGPVESFPSRLLRG